MDISEGGLRAVPIPPVGNDAPALLGKLTGDSKADARAGLSDNSSSGIMGGVPGHELEHRI
jgi:hypothetical protein